MYSARDRVENEDSLGRIERAADSLELGSEARTTAADLFLSNVPESDRSKPATAAASLYAAALIASEERSQVAVAEAMDVTRIAVQRNWKEVLRTAGFRPPEW